MLAKQKEPQLSSGAETTVLALPLATWLCQLRDGAVLLVDLLIANAASEIGASQGRVTFAWTPETLSAPNLFA